MLILWRKNIKECSSSYKWHRFREKESLGKEGFLLIPWVKFNYTIKKWFEKINPQIRTKQEHLDFMTKNKKECSSSDKWRKFKKEKNLDKKGFSSTPWRVFGYTCKEWFEKINPKIKWKTEQEHLDVMIKNMEACSCGDKWYKYRKENSLDGKGYLSHPWGYFGYSCKNWFEKINPKIKWKTEQKHLNIMRKNKKECSSSPKWIKFRKEKNLGEKGFLHSPWGHFGYTCDKWFSIIRQEK